MTYIRPFNPGKKEVRRARLSCADCHNIIGGTQDYVSLYRPGVLRVHVHVGCYITPSGRVKGKWKRNDD